MYDFPLRESEWNLGFLFEFLHETDAFLGSSTGIKTIANLCVSWKRKQHRTDDEEKGCVQRDTTSKGCVVNARAV